MIQFANELFAVVCKATFIIGAATIVILALMGACGIFHAAAKRIFPEEK